MAWRLRATNTTFMAGNQYAFFYWGCFAVYCIIYQLNRIRIYYIRKKRIAGQEDKVVTELPGAKLYHSLDKVVKIPFVTEMMSIRDIIGCFLFLVVNLIFTLFAPLVMNEGGWTLPGIRAIDLRMAFISMANWGFVFFCSQRNSILPAMSGLTFEQLMPWHRIIARIGMAELIPHFVYRIYQGVNRTGRAVDGLFRNTEYTTGSLAMFFFIIMFATSLEWVRRNHFEIFYWCHVFFLVPALITTAWHEPTCFAFFIPVMILWFADRVIRTYKSWFVKSTYIRVDDVCAQTASQEGIVRVLFENKAIKGAKPGQYVFASFVINGKKLWEYANWHPFTLSELFRVNAGNEHGIEERIVGSDARSKTEVSITDVKLENNGKKSPTNSLSDIDSMSDASSLRRRGTISNEGEIKNYASFHIKALGAKTADLLKAAAANNKLKVYIDGPHGPALQFQDYPVVAFFATGIGCTPAMIVIKEALEKRAIGLRTVATEQVYFNWAVRSIEEVTAFIDMFNYWDERSKTAISPINLNVNIFVTRMNEGPNPVEGLRGFSVIYGERPNVAAEMDKIKTLNATRRVFSHVCGNAAFTRIVINESHNHHFDAHHETFEF